MTKRFVLDCTVPLVDVQVQQQNLPGGRHRLGEKATRHVWNACRCQKVLHWLLLLGKSAYKITTSFDFCGAYSRNSLCLYSLSAAVSTPPFTISVQGAKLKVQKGEGGWQNVSNKMHISVSMSCFIARLAVLLQLIVVDRRERGVWYCQSDIGR